MRNHIENRDLIIEQIKKELFGPSHVGKDLDTNKEIKFSSYEDALGPWKELGTNQEILDLDSPAKRYGVGILFPCSTKVDEEDLDFASDGDGSGLQGISDDYEEVLNNDDKEKLIKSVSNIKTGNISSDGDGSPKKFELSLSNSFRPSSMGISFLARVKAGSKIIISGEMARYKRLKATINEKEVKGGWWVRVPIKYQIEYLIPDDIDSDIVRRKIKLENIKALGELNVGFELILRVSSSAEKLITVALVNRTEGKQFEDDKCLFQVEYQVKVQTDDATSNIGPYPEMPREYLDDEEKSFALLYRHSSTYAIGHGCSADWVKNAKSQFAEHVSAVALPCVEVPSTTADIKDESGNPIKVGMAQLAGLTGNECLSQAEELIKRYEFWIETQEKEELADLDVFYKATGEKHLGRCRESAERMKAGIKFLKKDFLALEAFKLANKAILLQQLRPDKIRKPEYDKKNWRLSFSPEFIEQDPLAPEGNRGSWRAFQIAFILMTIKSAVGLEDIDRETVELIWFPTGGGKTEAYLGLTAFSIFYRRLKDKKDAGVQVLMRYTLRLLTTQQFTRASRLICAMEIIRREKQDDLGDAPFSIGLWVGGANSPNTRKEAISILNSFSKPKDKAENKFVLDRCPWCSAEIGDSLDSLKGIKEAPKALGYKKQGGTVVIHCPDKKCSFHANLPVYVIDDDVYDIRPSIVLGTVDKFATLAWRPEARKIFGIADSGKRLFSPPGLIIQDELHLISGPLGSMVGLYEAVIEELCTDRRGGKRIKPKIVCSTGMYRKVCKWLKLGTGLQSEWQAG
jgi:hypothetical protein